MAEKLFLLDGMALSYRAYFSMIRTPLITSKGMNTSAIYGFINALNKLLTDENPDYIGVAFDTDEPTFRHKLYKDYKGTRQAMPDDLVPQIDKIKEIVMAYNIPMIEHHGYEADDIIGTLAKTAEKQKVLTYIVTPDKDFMQLVNKYIRMYKPSRSVLGKQVADIEIIDIDKVKERFCVTPDCVIDILALIGDKVDNVPGIKGIGEKTAVQLINDFGSLDGLYKNIDKVTKPKLRENLIAGKEDAYLSRTLVTIDTNIKLDLDFHQLKMSEKNTTLLEKIFTEMEFKTLLKKLQSSEQSINITAVSIESQLAEIGEPEKIEDIKSFKHLYYIIKTEAELKRMIEKLEESDEFAFLADTTSQNIFDAELKGLGFSMEEGEAFYVPLMFKEKIETDLFGNTTITPSLNKKGKKSVQQVENVITGDKGGLPSLDIETTLNMLKPLLENKNIKKTGHNIKHEIMLMKRFGINVDNIGFDTMIGAYVLRPETSNKMDQLSETYIKYKPKAADGEITRDDGGRVFSSEILPYCEISEYLQEDTDVSLRLYHRLEYELKKLSMDNLCTEIEFPLIEVLAEMEYCGVKADEEILQEQNEFLISEERRLEKEIYKIAGHEFNVNSTKQLAEVLFQELKLAPTKKIKTGFSTDTSVLEELRHEHPIAAKLLDYRVVTKLRSTYTEGLLNIMNKRTGKIHTSFNQCVAATGRLSSANPNLQNIPIRTEIGRKLRKAFVPEKKDNLILSADYSQIELRIMAHLANDENMIKAFERKHDIHRETAAKIFKVKADKVTPNMRRKAKEVNFGIIYGIQAFGLSSRLDIEQHEAREIIQTYFKEFPSISGWLEMTKKFAHEKGYTETLAGRRRYLANINNKNAIVRQRDERIAINMPVQGTAADMIKIAMINIYEEFKKNKMKSQMVLQVHDELVFDCAKDEIEEVERIVINKMRHALKLNVPIDVEVGIGSNWYEAHT